MRLVLSKSSCLLRYLKNVTKEKMSQFYWRSLFMDHW